MQGDTGVQGDTGDDGSSGAAGDTGVQGDTGVTGDTGEGGNLDPTPDSDETYSGTISQFTANENQAFGDVCYINGDGEMQLGDADAIATSKIVGMCADDTISADASGNYLLYGIARDDTWDWTVGGFIYLSTTGTTGNTLTQTAPSGTDDTIVIVGVATNADRMFFNPQLVIVEHV